MCPTNNPHPFSLSTSAPSASSIPAPVRDKRADQLLKLPRVVTRHTGPVGLQHGAAQELRQVQPVGLPFAARDQPQPPRRPDHLHVVGPQLEVPPPGQGLFGQDDAFLLAQRAPDAGVVEAQAHDLPVRVHDLDEGLELELTPEEVQLRERQANARQRREERPHRRQFPQFQVSEPRRPDPDDVPHVPRTAS